MHPDTWAECYQPNPPEGTLHIGIKIGQPDGTIAATAAIKPDKAEQPIWVELLDEKPVVEGTDWLVNLLTPLVDDVEKILIDGRGGGTHLADQLKKAGYSGRQVTQPTVNEVINAHAAILENINQHHLNHPNQPKLTTATLNATQRNIGTNGGWGWQPLTESSITPLESATLAHWAAINTKSAYTPRT